MATRRSRRDAPTGLKPSEGTARPGRVLIAGAGIAGLTLGLALARHGIASRIAERAERIDSIGAGIQLSPNATSILAEVGVLDRLWAAAVRPEAILLRDARHLRQRALIPLGEVAEQRWGSPYLTVHRADLQAALIGAVGREALIELDLGTAVISATAEPDGASVAFDKAPSEDFALAIGADGVTSALRRAIGGPAARSTGKIAYRATIAYPEPKATAILPAEQVSVFLHPGVHLVAYPVESGRSVNLVAVARGDAADGTVDPTRHFTTAHPKLRSLVSAVPGWSVWPIRTVDPSACWTSGGRICLIGDAAHAMTPYSAQGAAMAIEDAAILADCIAQVPADLPAALTRFAGLRHERIVRVARRGRLNELAWHAWGPVAIARNLVLAQRGGDRLAADLDWLYEWRRTP